MNKQEFSHYIDCFNRSDFAGFGQYYAADVVLEVIVDAEGLAAELATEFYALEDWPDFIVAPMKKGDAIRIVSFVHYTLCDGKFAHIKSARFRTL
jgi:hypothetical protein